MEEPAKKPEPSDEIPEVEYSTAQEAQEPLGGIKEVEYSKKEPPKPLSQTAFAIGRASLSVGSNVVNAIRGEAQRRKEITGLKNSPAPPPHQFSPPPSRVRTVYVKTPQRLPPRRFAPPQFNPFGGMQSSPNPFGFGNPKKIPRINPRDTHKIPRVQQNFLGMQNHAGKAKQPKIKQMGFADIFGRPAAKSKKRR